MKKKILLFVILVTVVVLNAQSIEIDYLFRIKPQFIDRYTDFKNPNKYYLKMNFADDSLLNTKIIEQIKGKKIFKVELVYTDFKTITSFDQPDLNKNRFENLKRYFPELYDNSFVEWSIISQTGAKNKETASTYFHGFVITVFPELTITERKNELLEVKEAVKIISVPIYEKKCRQKTKYYYLPVSKKKQEKGIKYSKKGIWNREKVTDITEKCSTIQVGQYDSVIVNGKLKSIDSKLKLGTELMSFSTDTVVTSVLNRNNWNNMTVVVDVTGSMGGYTSQLLQWIALANHSKRIKSLVCFNDGNMKADNVKKMGSVGGIYHSDSNSVNNFIYTMTKSMTAGGGGDAPENNIEAVLSAIKKDPTIKEVILIVDNYANMRDYSMISEVKIPVRVIVCGNLFGVNTQYLDLARNTKGSIHTMEDDLTKLYDLNEGEEIKIGKMVYTIKNGKFVVYNKV